MQNALLKNNALLSQLKSQLRENTPRVQGRIKSTDKSFGFLETEEGTSYFIAPPAMKKVIHGDVVSALVHEETDKNGQLRTSAEPEELIEPSLTHFIARIHQVQGKKISLVADHPNIKNILPAQLEATTNLEANSLTPGDWVSAQLTKHPLQTKQPNFSASIKQLIAKNADPYAPWWVVLARHQLPAEQPLIEADWQLQDPEGLVRQDLTQISFFTLDSASTLDMDDALAISQLPEGGWELHLAIADPDAYIPVNSPADLEAQKRAFTLYLPARTVTMLPKILSDDLCSLREGQRRPALVASLRLDANGALIGAAEFKAAWIQSQAKLDYLQVSDWLEGKPGWQPEQAVIATSLQQLQACTAARLAWRQQNALVFKDFPDYNFILNDQDEVVAIQAEERRLGHKMVEEAMLLANFCAAEFLAANTQQAVYNVHQGFDADKLDAALELIQAQLPQENPTVDAGQFTSTNLATLAGFRQLRLTLDQLESGWLDARLRRYQAYSVVATQAGPHFGLGFAHYATWTSPLRRYGDLVNQRLIKAVLAQQEPQPLAATLANELSEARKINRQAERELKDWLYARFLSSQVGHRFTGEIFNINRGGMRVRLLENGASVFIPASSLHPIKDELNLDAEQGWVKIQDTLAYRLTDQVQVELTEVKVDQRSVIGKAIG